MTTRPDETETRCGCLHDVDEWPYPYATYDGFPAHPPYEREQPTGSPGERLRCRKSADFGVRSAYPDYGAGGSTNGLEEDDETFLCRDCTAGWMLEKIRWHRLTVRPLRPR